MRGCGECPQSLEKLHAIADARRTFLGERVRQLGMKESLGCQIQELRDAPSKLAEILPKEYKFKMWANLHQSRAVPKKRTQVPPRATLGSTPPRLSQT